MIQKTLDLDECLRVLPNAMLDLLHVLALILHTRFSGVKSSPWKWMEQSRDNQTKHVHRFPKRWNWSFPPIFHGLLLLMTNSKAWEWSSQAEMALANPLRQNPCVWWSRCLDYIQDAASSQQSLLAIGPDHGFLWCPVACDTQNMTTQ